MITEKEFDRLDTNGFHVMDFPKEVQDAFQKIKDAVLIDSEELSDGQVLDLIYDYLCDIGVEDEI